jgi:hypothetical protein
MSMTYGFGVVNVWPAIFRRQVHGEAKEGLGKFMTDHVIESCRNLFFYSYFKVV